jgi:hypothetical protein
VQGPLCLKKSFPRSFLRRIEPSDAAKHHPTILELMMNKKIYSLVWNKSLRQIVVASELASIKGGSGSTGETRGLGARWLTLVLGVALALGTVPWAMAAPAKAKGQTNCSGASATAAGALACGKGANASGVDSTAIGVNATASG